MVEIVCILDRSGVRSAFDEMTLQTTVYRS